MSLLLDGNTLEMRTHIEGLPWQQLYCSETLAVDNGRARLAVVLFADPHLLEGGQRGQGRTADPEYFLSGGAMT